MNAAAIRAALLEVPDDAEVCFAVVGGPVHRVLPVVDVHPGADLNLRDSQGRPVVRLWTLGRAAREHVTLPPLPSYKARAG